MPPSDLRVHNGGSRSHKGNHSMKDEVLTGIERLAPDHVYIHKLTIFSVAKYFPLFFSVRRTPPIYDRFLSSFINLNARVLGS